MPMNRNPTVVFAVDGRFAMPLAVSVASAAANLDPSRELTVYVIDGGLSDRDRVKVERSLPARRVAVHWMRPDLRMLDALPISQHVTAATYFRLLVGRVLPSSVDRAIYLDSDTLVLDDLGLLWDQPLGNHAALAVQEMAAPFLDAPRSMPNYEACKAYLSAEHPVSNYRELELDPAGKYFNAGVMVLDLRQWRDGDLTAQFLRCLREHEKDVLWWDQYALNVVLVGRWGELHPRWNLHTGLFKYPSAECSPLAPEVYRETVARPAIVHFTTPLKPWQFGDTHPFRQRFFEYLDRTPWAGWRPSGPHSAPRQWFERQAGRAVSWLSRQAQGGRGKG